MMSSSIDSAVMTRRSSRDGVSNFLFSRKNAEVLVFEPTHLLFVQFSSVQGET